MTTLFFVVFFLRELTAVSSTQPKARAPKRVSCRLPFLPCQTILISINKRYMSALESRLHEAEALLGVIISSNDMRAKTLVFDLTKDSLANTIIKRVSHSVFGPIGRKSLLARGSGLSGSESQASPATFRGPTDSRRQQMNSREVAMMGDGGVSFDTQTKQHGISHLGEQCRQSRIHDSQQHVAGPPQ